MAQLTLLLCGSPCQSFSIAGQREGMDGASGLVREYFRLLQEVKPTWFVWENVPGVFSSNGGRDFSFIMSKWHELGYNVSYRVLDAQFFGVAQRRRRVFAVGHIANWRNPAKVLFEPESLRGNSSQSRKKRQAHPGCAQASPYTPSSFGGYAEGTGTLRASGGDFGGGSEMLIAKTLCAKPGYRLNPDDETLIPAKSYCAPIALAIGASGPPCSRTDNERTEVEALVCQIEPKITPPITSKWARQGWTAYDETAPLVMKQREGKPGGGKGPLFGDKSFTLACGQDQTLFWQGVRRLTPLEAERLQGFPDHYTDIEFRGKPAADGVRYKALGNSMCVNVMRWIGKRIQAVEDGEL